MSRRSSLILLLSLLVISATQARTERYSTAIFAGGCFWCMEADFEKLPGVIAVVSGYSGGKLKDPTYEQVSSGTSGHSEVVEVRQAGTFYPAEAYHQDHYKKNPIRYRFYRYSCGRDERVNQLWGSE